MSAVLSNSRHHAEYVLLGLAAELTGYTVKALRMKIEEGVFIEGREYVRSPDGRIHIHMPGYYQWVAKAQA